MTLPDYERPFEPADFRGYFKWTKILSKKLKGNHLYHACHRKELQEIIDKNELTLRSSWSIKLPEHGLRAVPGVWCGLNYFFKGNHYGCFLIQFSLSVLEGKQFIAFRRGGQSKRNRYFFVQYEAMIPIYSFKGDVWRRVNPEVYFQKNKDETLRLKDRAIYEVVLTSRVSLDESVSISGVNHEKCIPVKCNGSSKGHSRKVVRQIAKKMLKKDIFDMGLIKNIIKKYPDIKGETLTITIE